MFGGVRAAMGLGLQVSLNNQFVGPLQPPTETDDEIVILPAKGQGHHPKANSVRILDEVACRAQISQGRGLATCDWRIPLRL